MSELVPQEDIERLVGRKRHPWAHYGRADSASRTVYVMHSKECLDSGIDLRDCEYSRALDKGYLGAEDTLVCLGVSPVSGKLFGRNGSAHA